MRTKKATPSGTLKEIRLRPETDKHDLAIKVNHAREFLEKGHMSAAHNATRDKRVVGSKRPGSHLQSLLKNPFFSG